MVQAGDQQPWLTSHLLLAQLQLVPVLLCRHYSCFRFNAYAVVTRGLAKWQPDYKHWVCFKSSATHDDPASAGVLAVVHRVPLPTWGLILMLLPATLLLMAILVIPFWEQNFTMMCATTSALFGGFLLYPLMSWLKEREWMHFSNLQFDFAHSHAGNARSYTIHASGGLNYDPTYNAGGGGCKCEHLS